MTINPPVFTLLFILFVALSVLSIALLFLSFTPLGQTLIKYRFSLLSLALGCLASYLISLMSIFIDPYWIDNRSRETIVFPAHFGFALFTAPLFQLLITPTVFIAMKFVRHLKQR